MEEKAFSEMTQKELLQYIHNAFAGAMVDSHEMVKLALEKDGAKMGYRLAKVQDDLLEKSTRGQLAAQELESRRNN